MAQFFDSILRLALTIVPGWNDPNASSSKDNNTLLPTPASLPSSSLSSTFNNSTTAHPPPVITAEFERLHGGMTNAVYKLTLLHDKPFLSGTTYPSTTIVRVVNPYLETTIDRQKEREIIQQCASLQISPVLYGTSDIDGNYDTATKGNLISSTSSSTQGTGENSSENASSRLLSFSSSPSLAPSEIDDPTTNARKLSVRFEEYIEGKTLALPDLRNPLLAPYLAYLVARFHYQEDILGHNLRLLALLDRSRNSAATTSSSSSFNIDATPPSPLSSVSATSSSSSWALPAQYRGYLSTIHDIQSATSIAYRNQYWSPTLRRLFDYCSWDNEIHWLTSTLLTKQNHTFPFRKYECILGNTVLSHGDLQEHNWLVNENGRLYLIDYEYSGKNCNGFDIGNLYCEHLCAYGSQFKGAYRFDGYMAYPSIEWQRAFLISYVQERRKIYAYVRGSSSFSSSSSSSSSPLEPVIVPSTVPINAKSDSVFVLPDDGTDNASLHKQSRKCTSIAPSILDEVFAPDGPYDEQFMQEVKEVAIQARVGILASHLYWSLWSIVLAAQQVTPDGTNTVVSLSTASTPTTGTGSKILTTPVSLKNENIQELASPSASHTFDYAAYGYDRIKEYLRLRKELEQDLLLYRDATK